MKAKLTRIALIAVTALTLVLSACKPTDIVMHNTQVERDVQTYFCQPGNLSNPDCK